MTLNKAFFLASLRNLAPTVPAGYIVDTLTAKPVHAYSLQRLSSSYTGAALRVTRDTDNTQMDIGYNATGALDMAAANAFKGAGNLRVDTWYDQGSGAKNLNRVTSNPRLILNNGRPVIECMASAGFDGTPSNFPTSELSIRLVMCHNVVYGSIPFRVELVNTSQTINVHAPWTDNNIYWDMGTGRLSASFAGVPPGALSNILLQGSTVTNSQTITANGTVIGTSNALNTTPMSAPTRMILQASGGGNHQYSELMIFSSTLSTSDKNLLNTYSVSKFGN